MKKYEGLPFFMTGDYNTHECVEMYQTFMDTLGVKNAKYEADVMVRLAAGGGIGPHAGNEGPVMYP